MKFSSIKTMPRNVVRDTVKSIERNNLMSAASILSVIAALMILGIFLILSINVEEVTKDVESKLELKVFLQQDFTEAQKLTVEQALENSDMIESVTFESAQEALDKFSSSLDEYSSLLSGYNSENNPMPASFIIRVNDPSDLEAVQDLAMDYKGQGVEYVRYGQEYVQALVSFNKFTNTLSIVVLIVLSVISIFIIYNTIKLTVFARRREIGIMKYVGATNNYIRAPFILEGTFLGLIGAIVAIFDHSNHILLYIGFCRRKFFPAGRRQFGIARGCYGKTALFLSDLWRVYRSSWQCICNSQVFGCINLL